MKKIKVDSHPDYEKDSSTGGVINTNVADFNRRQKEKRRIKQDLASSLRMNDIEADINNINNDLSEIKDLLRTLINGNANS